MKSTRDKLSIIDRNDSIKRFLHTLQTEFAIQINTWTSYNKMEAEKKKKKAERPNEHWQVIERDSSQFNLEETPTPFCLSPSRRLQNLALVL